MSYISKAEKLGRERGKNAGEWVFDGNTSRYAYEVTLAGIESCDPKVMDAFSPPNLSGEYADSGPVDLADELGITVDHPSFEDAATAYEDAASTAFWQEVERAARAALEPEYVWIIDKSYIEDSIPLDDWGKLTKGVPYDEAGPRYASERQLKECKRHGRPFRMFDDDGILYYSGRWWTENAGDLQDLSEEAFGPLDDYGAPNAGAVTIKYRNKKGAWEAL